MRRFWNLLRAWSGLLILLAAAVAAYAQIIRSHRAHERSDVVTIRICHWQLEPGFRETLAGVIEDYQRLYEARTGHPVRLVQLPINGRAYQQFVNCGLIGGVAPDIIEMGRGDTVTRPSYVGRLFEPLGAELAQPNPYNEGTDLSSTPWRSTFVDGLQSAFDATLLDYYQIPFSFFTVRYFCNLDLYRRITGRDTPPRSFAELRAFFAETQRYSRESGQAISALGGSRAYHLGHLVRQYAAPFTYGVVAASDLDGDAKVRDMEAYLAFRDGTWNYGSPALHAMRACLKEITSQFQDGWQAAQRDDAVYLFLQERCVLLSSGAWDAGSIPDLCSNRFAVGVWRLPPPSDEPAYGPFYPAPATETFLPAIVNWGVNARSRHKEVCLDFLKYCTSRAVNERFCRTLTWLPAITGAGVAGPVQPFRPDDKGIYCEFDGAASAEARLKQDGLLWMYLSGRMTSEAYADEMNHINRSTGDDGFRRALANERVRTRDGERLLAGLLGRAAVGAADAQLDARLRERLSALAVDRFRNAELADRFARAPGPGAAP